ncbi:acyl carrier protein [Dactylosporangium sp. NPDC051541]|uniref:acyl carrier protein n=1 Tax=Dactylosporangium sp. NPDC051541 TaxID=3363977 RepID=UPI00379D5583
MNAIEDFLELVRDELGLPVTAENAGQRLDELPGWDSVHLLWLLTALERSTGRSVSLPDVLQAGSLADIYALTAIR